MVSCQLLPVPVLSWTPVSNLLQLLQLMLTFFLSVSQEYLMQQTSVFWNVLVVEGTVVVVVVMLCASARSCELICRRANDGCAMEIPLVVVVFVVVSCSR